MPKYKYHLKNGKFLSLEGDTPPSDDEVASIAKEQGVDLMPADETPSPEPAAQPTTQAPTEKPGMLSRAWHMASDPLTDLPSRAGRAISNYMTEPDANTAPTGEGGFRDALRVHGAQLRGFIGGAAEGLGDVASSLTSPINLATTALSGGSSLAGRAGYTGAANLLNIGARAAAVPVVAHGAGEVFSPESTLAQRGQGVAEIAGGLLGMKGHTPAESKLEFTKSVPQENGLSLGENKAMADAAIGPQKLAENQTILLKGKHATPENIKALKDSGYELAGSNDRGDLRYRKPETPTTPKKSNPFGIDAFNAPETLTETPTSIPSEITEPLAGKEPTPQPEGFGDVKSSFKVGKESYTPKFENDVDKALFEINRRMKNKKKFSDYLDYVTKETGMSRDEVLAKSKELHESIMSDVSQKPSGEIPVSSFHNKGKLKMPGDMESGINPEESFKFGKRGEVPSRLDKTGPNDLYDIETRQIIPTAEDLAGMSPEQQPVGQRFAQLLEEFPNKMEQAGTDTRLEMARRMHEPDNIDWSQMPESEDIIRPEGAPPYSGEPLTSYGMLEPRPEISRSIAMPDTGAGDIMRPEQPFAPTPDLPLREGSFGNEPAPFVRGGTRPGPTRPGALDRLLTNEQGAIGDLSQLKLKSGAEGEGGRTVLNRAMYKVDRNLNDVTGSFKSPEEFNAQLAEHPEFRDKLINQRVEQTAQSLREAADFADKENWAPNVPGQKEGAVQAGQHLRTMADELEKSPDKVDAFFRLKRLLTNEEGSMTVGPRKPKIPRSIKDAKNMTPEELDAALAADAESKKPSIPQEVSGLIRTLRTGWDLSAPLRQGIGLIHRPEFWKAMPDMFRAAASEEGFQAIQDSIRKDPLFEPKGPNKPSFAEESGLRLTDLGNDLSQREEMMMSKWAEKIPGIRASNRGYTAVLNKMRADTFKSLIANAVEMSIEAETGHAVRPGFKSRTFTPQGAQQLNPFRNKVLAKGLADYVNTSTGRGSLGAYEASAQALNTYFFAPRLMASRLKMLNPAYYMQANPMVRKEAIKSLLAVAAFGTGIGQITRFGGQSAFGKKAVTIEPDMASADFGKIKIGNVRIDPFAGFQQYVVLAQRMLPEMVGGGRFQSTTSGKEYKLGSPRFGRSSRLDVAERFLESKANPIGGLGISALRGTDFTGKPFDLPEGIAELFVPMFAADLKELITESPDLIPFIHKKGAYQHFKPQKLPFAVPAFFGMSEQEYGPRK